MIFDIMAAFLDFTEKLGVLSHLFTDNKKSSLNTVSIKNFQKP